MKKVAVFAVLTVLAGCTSSSDNIQIVSSSSEEVYTAEQVRSMEQARVRKETVAIKEVAVAPVPVKRATTPVKPQPAAQKQVVKKQPVYQPKSVAPVYKQSLSESEGYTIQVLALSHNKGFRPYMNKLPSNQPVWVNKKQLQGVPWYTMLFGHYRTREEAKRALNALPQDVKDYGPFIRSLREIKSSPTPKLTKLN